MPRILGVDYGTRRLGFAVSDETGCIALPLCIAEIRNQEQAISETRRIFSERHAEQILVGVPLSMDGTKGRAALAVEEFARKLEVAGIPVVYWDERLSSAQVERMLVESNASRSRRREVCDKLAAQVVLQSYLDRQAMEHGAATSAMAGDPDGCGTDG